MRKNGAHGVVKSTNIKNNSIAFIWHSWSINHEHTIAQSRFSPSITITVTMGYQPLKKNDIISEKVLWLDYNSIIEESFAAHN